MEQKIVKLPRFEPWKATNMHTLMQNILKAQYTVVSADVWSQIP